jgi:peptidoglycan/LPS O-acetylase OafA/YrhL
LVVCGAALLSPPFLWEQTEHRWLNSIGLTLGLLGAGAVISALVCRGVTENGATKSLALVGRHSYSIYLWHTFVQSWLVPLLELPEPLEIPAYFALSLGLGIQLSQWIEIPALKLRDRVLRTRLTSAPAALQAT